MIYLPTGKFVFVSCCTKKLSVAAMTPFMLESGANNNREILG
jgi:hypothetical protein